MSETDLKRLERLFQEAADLPKADRAAFLERACAGDAGLRARLEAMLLEMEREGSLAIPAIGPGAGPSERPGSHIGRYKLLQVIGEGGFGVVYMAEQTEPVVRCVALKIIKLGMDTKEVVARFEAERQALALMDHPGIARVLDGGATGTGRPYFVMDLVRGVSITEYCDANSLGARARLELFLDVCAAIEHAHQKGVIHRDLKPTNVMVTLHDGRPVTKVIDFGIAKAMHTRLTEKTLFTAYERFIGTPAYMSPEQAEMSGLDVDTRSDVYSLGVLLYELLTGSTPFDPSALMQEGLAEVKRVIREEPAPRPSLRISTTADATIAGRRSSDLRSLSRRVRGDLDWIVMRALEKERARRYGTVSELAADVRRHLADEPVVAGPPSKVYRMRKFLARNRAATASVSLITLLVIGGAIGTSIGMWEAGQQRDEALASNERAQAVTEFLIDTLSLADPEIAPDPDVSVRTLLDRASRHADGAFLGQPRAEARVRATIGRAYCSLGENEQAEANLRRALALIEALGEVDPLEHYTVLWGLTHVLFRLERADALQVAQRARRVAHAAIEADYPELGAALERFIRAVDVAAFGAGGASVAELPGLFDETARRFDAKGPPAGDPWRLIAADTWMAAGFSLWYTPHEALSEPMFAKALEVQRQELPPNHPQIGETVSQLIGVLGRAGRAGEAEAYIRDVVELLRGVYHEGNFNLAYLESMLGDNLVRQGRLAEAEPLLVESHEAIRASIGSEAVFYVADSCGRVILLYEAWGKEELAAPYRAELARICAVGDMLPGFVLLRMAFGPEHAEIASRLDGLFAACGDVFHYLSKRVVPSADLGPTLGELLELRRATLADDDPLSAAIARALLAWAKALEPGTADGARRRMVEEALAILACWAEEGRFDAADGHAQLSELAFAAADFAGAARHARLSWEILRDLLGADDWMTANAKVRVARCLVQQGLYAEAESVLRPSHEVLVEQVGERHPETAAARALIHELYVAWGKPDEAAAWAGEL